MAGKDEDQAELTLEVEPRFYTLEQVSKYLNVSGPQVYSLVRSGDLPAIKIGGRGVWRVDRHKLEEYIERVTEETQQWVRTHPLTKKEQVDVDQRWEDGLSS